MGPPANAMGPLSKFAGPQGFVYKFVGPQDEDRLQDGQGGRGGGRGGELLHHSGLPLAQPITPGTTLVRTLDIQPNRV